jgi:hypothetical protein
MVLPCRVKEKCPRNPCEPETGLDAAKPKTHRTSTVLLTVIHVAGAPSEGAGKRLRERATARRPEFRCPRQRSGRGPSKAAAVIHSPRM